MLCATPIGKVECKTWVLLSDAEGLVEMRDLLGSRAVVVIMHLCYIHVIKFNLPLVILFIDK